MEGKHPLQSKGGKDGKDAAPKLGLKWVGCYGSESSFGEGKVYGGGASGAYINAAAELARAKKMRYIAIARVDRTPFLCVSSRPAGKKLKDWGCKKSA